MHRNTYDPPKLDDECSGWATIPAGEEAIRSVTLIVYQNRHLDRTPVEKGGAVEEGVVSAPDLLASLIHLF